MNNYWTEVLATRQRDAVIQTLENDQLPDEEAALLAQAKRCSDLLIDTETDGPAENAGLVQNGECTEVYNDGRFVIYDFAGADAVHAAAK